jgi:hypothetical protein
LEKPKSVPYRTKFFYKKSNPYRTFLVKSKNPFRIGLSKKDVPYRTFLGKGLSTKFGKKTKVERFFHFFSENSHFFSINDVIKKPKSVPYRTKFFYKKYDPYRTFLVKSKNSIRIGLSKKDDPYRTFLGRSHFATF